MYPYLQTHLGRYIILSMYLSLIEINVIYASA